MPVKVVAEVEPLPPDACARGGERESVNPVGTGPEPMIYTLGVGADWRDRNGTRQPGFLTVAHPFWKRGHKASADVVTFGPPAFGFHFWLRSVCILDPADGVDASLHRLDLLTNPGAPPRGARKAGTATDRAAVEDKFCPDVAFPVVSSDDLTRLRDKRAKLAFEPGGGGPWCQMTSLIEVAGATDPDDNRVAMEELKGRRHLVRAKWLDQPRAQFDEGFSGLPWTFENQLVGIQVGAGDPERVFPALYGYALQLAKLRNILDDKLNQPAFDYEAGSLRIAHCF